MKNTLIRSIGTQFADRTSMIRFAAHLAFWCFTLVYLETLLHAVVFGGFALRFLYAVGFSAVLACILAVFSSLLPEKIQFPITLIVTVVLVFLYGSQMVYNYIFGTLYSAAAAQLGGDALTSFWKETLYAMGDHILALALLLVPPAALVAIRKVFRGRSSHLCRIAAVLIAVLLQLITVQCLNIGGTGFFTDSYFYRSSDVTTHQVAERFGLLTAMRLELFSSGESEELYYIEETEPPATQATEPAAVDDPVEEPVIEYNVLDIDFDALNALTDNETIQAINNYCASLAGTSKNEYTGMLADYNLILICAESFSTAAIDPEVTPTLYALANEGIIFNNYYNTFPNTTTDGEYALCQGLYPDSTRDKTASSFYASRSNYLPYALGNIFSQQRGIASWGYHNYKGDYYSRNQTHPNLGYSMKFAGDGMTFTSTWPASDLEMMEQSIGDYIAQDQFHAYYMTFSGHYRYDTETNIIARRNWDAVKDLDYSSHARAYLSCHIELDRALEYLMQQLEEGGIADRTAIVLAGDHFPYGLSNSQYSELVGYEIDDFTKFKSSLIFWVGGLEENIIVDEYCCNVDILPTILNLWGFDYDSRLLPGTDVFSDGTHVAVLNDKSFFTDQLWFNANTGEVRYLVDKSEVSETYIENMIRMIKTKSTVSVDILNTDYYRFVFETNADIVNGGS